MASGLAGSDGRTGGGRPPVFGGSLLLELDEYRRFRHRVRHIYGYELEATRVLWRGGDRLEMFERLQVMAGSVRVGKYALHWQDAAGQLRQRWDNAAHHLEVSTHPHHMHDGAEAHVQPHGPTSAEEVLRLIASAAEE